MTSPATGRAAVIRPRVSVIVPFVGSDSELEELIGRLRSLHHNPDDELIIADNRASGDPDQQPRTPGVLVHDAGGIRSPGFARNRGAAAASGAWLVFIDADTEPVVGLIDTYFEPPPDEQTAILAGRIEDIAVANPRTGRASLAARHATARGHMADQVTLGRPRFPYAQTANCAVRRSAFVEIGGFAEEARAGEDADLCIRLQARGWNLESRPQAAVRHRTRATTAQALSQLAVHGAGAAWCDRQHPGSFPGPTSRELLGRLAHSAGDAVRAAARGERERAGFAALDMAEALAFESGRLLSNRVRR